MVCMDKQYLISKFVHRFTNENFVALWHSLRMEKVYGKKMLNDIYEYFCTPRLLGEAVSVFPEAAVDELADRGFIVCDESCDLEVLAQLKQKVGLIDTRNLVLLVSNDCNFRCLYCQIEENMENKNMINMSIEVAQKALDLLKRNSNVDAKKTITITGGEPLLNIPVVKFIIERARASFENTRIVIFTNGSLVTNELARYFRDNDILVLVSLDGPEEMHNKVRMNKANKGTFDSAMNGYNILKDEGCNVGISAVGGKHNIEKLDETFGFFTELTPPSIGFNFSHFLIGKENPTEIPIELFGKILRKFYEQLREKGIFLENISRPITAFTSNIPKVNECQAQGKGLTVDARGKVGPCKSLLVNDIYSEDIDNIVYVKDNSMFKSWAKRSPLIEDGCKDCAALSICGGGCAYDSFISYSGDYKKIDERICRYEKDMLEYLLWDLMKNIRHMINDNNIYFPSEEDQKKAFERFYDINNELQKSVGHENEK